MRVSLVQQFHCIIIYCCFSYSAVFLAPAPVCRQAAELVARSQEVRGGIQGLIVSIETQKTQAHGRVTSSVAQSVQEANSKKVITI